MSMYADEHAQKSRCTPQLPAIQDGLITPK